MTTHTANRKRQLIFLLSLILVAGFLATSLVSYFVSLSSLRNQITSSSLPLTSDNIYSEIQRDLLRPIFISSLMSNDTFFRDWVLGGERDEAQVTRYLKEIMVKYGAFTSFFVSEATRIYYHANGVLKKVKPEEERDRWYFRVREMEPDYEINVDPDLANRDALTIFINHKVYDYEGRYIGATGVGLTVRAAVSLIESYRRKYNRNVYFVDQDGRVILRGDSFPDDADTIMDMEGISSIAEDILAAGGSVYQYSRQGKIVHLNSRFVPELEWYLLVEQAEAGAIAHVHSTLVLNLVLCALITSIVIGLTTFTINAYQKVNQKQQEEIVEQHRELLEKNTKLEKALVEVKRLSGLLPICASCKKIRDDGGYWRQIEAYIRDHSEADFSHGICPDCARKLYPGITDGIDFGAEPGAPTDG